MPISVVYFQMTLSGLEFPTTLCSLSATAELLVLSFCPCWWNKVVYVILDAYKYILLF